MPPGIDGVETARRIRALDGDVFIVIVTAFSDYHPNDIAAAIEPADKLFYLAKPLEPTEITQMSVALGRNWALDREIERSQQHLQEANTRLIESEARATYLAHHDALTGLPNRLAFLKRLDDGIEARQHARDGLKVGIIDLDGFKEVNDRYGHQAGDELIRTAGRRIAETVGPDAFVARLGGDEFAVLFAAAASRDETLAAARRVVGSFLGQFTILGVSVVCSASLGITIAGGDGRLTPVELMRQADIALYAAKANGKQQVVQFDQAMDNSIRLRHQISEELRGAVERNELALYYQPQISSTDRSIHCLEALVRWHHPTRGLVSPGEFVPIAEETGFIHQLGEWVIRTAMHEARSWPDLTVAVNVSTVQFRAQGFAERVIELARRAGIDPARFELEVTESIMFTDLEQTLVNLQRLKAHGFRLALDDFGTGYSSIGYLRDFPFDKLKIDGSFIRAIGSAANAPEVLQAVVSLGKAMEYEITAEGVESEQQHDFLKAISCTLQQGYLFYRPMSKEMLDRLLNELRRQCA
jgi:diguanylate cyclase (GGDEF)-like protein